MEDQHCEYTKVVRETEFIIFYKFIYFFFSSIILFYRFFLKLLFLDYFNEVLKCVVFT